MLFDLCVKVPNFAKGENKQLVEIPAVPGNFGGFPAVIFPGSVIYGFDTGAAIHEFTK
jgi:hypothetical protein